MPKLKGPIGIDDSIVARPKIKHSYVFARGNRKPCTRTGSSGVDHSATNGEGSRGI